LIVYKIEQRGHILSKYNISNTEKGRGAYVCIAYNLNTESAVILMHQISIHTSPLPTARGSLYGLLRSKYDKIFISIRNNAR
jgi:hypothetical protein